MNTSETYTPLEQVVLGRLLVAGEKGATPSDLKKALDPLVGHRWAGAAFTEGLRQVLGTLEAKGLTTTVRKGKSERTHLTTRGQRAGLEVVGIDQLPPKTTWDKLRKTYLAARALGLPTPKDAAAKSFGNDNGFKAALLKARFDLPISDYPSFDQALDALAWKLLELPPQKKFDVKTVKAALIRRALGDAKEIDPKLDPKKEATKLLAQKVGARQSGKDELRLAALREWIDGKETSPQPPFDLHTFARRVVEAARLSPTGRFGDNKVFVVHVWRLLQNDPTLAGMTPDDFKNRLAEANNARLLDLSRADLVEAMNPHDVALSEVRYQGATFHFVRI